MLMESMVLSCILGSEGLGLPPEALGLEWPGVENTELRHVV